MQKGIGEGHTRGDHRKVANGLYRHYAKGRDLRRLEAIVGRDGMMKADIVMLDFADAFEKDFVGQGMTRRTVQETLDRGLELMKKFSLEAA
jgi:V/A-type H+-transporting ATPase subunit B